MSSYDRTPDADDMFSDTRMTFGEHIEDLRAHLIRAILGFVIAMVAAFFIAKPVLNFISRPVEKQLAEYWHRYNDKKQIEIIGEMKDKKFPPITTPISMPARDFAAAIEKAFPGFTEKFGPKEFEKLNLLPDIEVVLHALDMDEAIDEKLVDSRDIITFPNARLPDPLALALEIQKYYQLVRPPTLSTLSVQEAFVVYFQVALGTGFVLGSPWIFYQLWMFIAAGLYPHEKKYVNIFLPFSLALFLAGVFVCEWAVMSKAVEALLWFNEWLGFSPELRLNEWLGFAIFMPLVFGISFQTPLVMLFLQRVGLFSVDAFRGKRRIAWFVMAVFAAVITPSVDPISMMFLWVPMGLLYELGILLCIYFPGRPLLDFDLSESEELVEV